MNLTFRIEAVVGWNQRVEPLLRAFVYQRHDQMSANWSVTGPHDTPGPNDLVGLYLGDGLVLVVPPK